MAMEASGFDKILVAPCGGAFKQPRAQHPIYFVTAASMTTFACIFFSPFEQMYDGKISELPDLPGLILSRTDPEIIRSSEETRSART